MSDPEQEQGKGPPSTKPKRVWIGTSLVILFGLSAVNIFLLLYVVPKFEQIYADAFPGWPLPTVTQVMITARMVLVTIDLGWPILGTVLIKRQKPSAILWINVGLIWTFLQPAITVYALIKPMIGLHIGMGEGK